MKLNKIEEQIVITNYKTMKYGSIVILGIATFLLFSDFIFKHIWDKELIAYYQILGIAFIIIATATLGFFWLTKSSNIRILKIGTLLFPGAIILWAAVFTVIDLKNEGLMTYVIVLLICTSFLYFNLIEITIFITISLSALYLTMYATGVLNSHIWKLTLLFVPSTAFPIVMSIRNYKTKEHELQNQQEICDVNASLRYLNENLEKEVVKRTEELQKAKEKAEENDKLKTAFLQNMSHEIRTPMNAIMGFSDLMKKNFDNKEKLEKFVKIINQRSSDLMIIIDDILDISKIESGQMTVKYQSFFLSELFSEIETAFIEQQRRLNKQDIVFQLILPSSPESIVFNTDKDKLKQVFFNLIGNAFKFTQTGKIEAGFKFSENNNLQFYVSDTGIGIPEDKHNAIFERFTQIESDLQQMHSGNGLGLPIVKGLIDLLDGEIWLESKPGQGTTFYFTIRNQNQT